MTDWFNYHHLFYFWTVATEGGVNKAAVKLRLSPSALSSQIKSLEEFFGQRLFLRKNQRLFLSETGKIAFEYAASIFSTGAELLHVMQNPVGAASRKVLRIGALAGLSKNLQFQFLAPSLSGLEVSVVVRQGTLTPLLRELENHLLDVVISNMPVRTDQQRHFYNHKMAEIPSVVVGTERWRPLKKNFPQSLNGCPLFVPTFDGKLRSDFERFLKDNKISAVIRAEVEDVALLRIFALSGRGVAILPEVAIEREISEKRLWVLRRVPELSETFYAVTTQRKFANPMVAEMLGKFRERYLK